VSEILTQEEIDSLLSVVTTGGVPDGPGATPRRHRTILPYDFRRPNRVAKEQVRTLQMLHDAFARNLSASLSAYLRSLLEVQLTSVEQLTYGEFMRSVAAPATLGIFEMAPLKGEAVLDINPRLLFPMIDRILGGAGRPAVQIRELTEIERALGMRILRLLLANLQQAWAQAGRFDVRLLSLETNPQFVQLASPNDIAVLVTFNVRLGEVEGVMSLCLPFAMLEPVLPKLLNQRCLGAAPAAEPRTSSREIEGHLRATALEVRAVLEAGQVPINQLTHLEPGDILPLPWREDLRVIVEVGGRPRFAGRAGRKQRRRAVEITAALDAEGERHG